jgi:hypothetical protein
MMFLLRNYAVILATALALALTAFAGDVATVTSTAPFELHGATVTSDQGVPSWPAMSGDSIKSGAAPVVINLPDGSRFVLDPGSSARIDSTSGTPVFHLLSGTVHYMLVKLTAARLMALNNPVNPTSLDGDYSIAPHPSGSSSWWTPGHTVLTLLGAGGLTALGLGIAGSLTSGPPVSPSR